MTETRISINPGRIYWDSCTYLDYLVGDRPYQTSLLNMIKSWESGRTTLITSALTIAEVLYVKCYAELQKMDINRKPDIEALFDPPANLSPLLIVEVTRDIALAARELVWNHGIKPKDAIHVASAIEAHCDVLYSNDGGLKSKSLIVGGNPILKIEAPSWVVQPTLPLGN